MCDDFLVVMVNKIALVVGMVVSVHAFADAPKPPPPLACNQVLLQCFTSPDPNAQQACASRATTRASWYMTALDLCRRVQNCRVPSCMETGCKNQLAACRADQDPAVTELPFTFEGEWHQGGVSASGFWNPTTGWSSATSSGSSFNFKTDGTFEFAIMLVSKISVCSAGALKYTSGTWKVDGNKLTLVEKQAKISTANTCNNKKAASDLKPETSTFDVQLAPSEFGGDPELTLLKDGKAWANPYRHR